MIQTVVFLLILAYLLITSGPIVVGPVSAICLVGWLIIKQNDDNAEIARHRAKMDRSRRNSE